MNTAASLKIRQCLAITASAAINILPSALMLTMKVLQKAGLLHMKPQSSKTLKKWMYLQELLQVHRDLKLFIQLCIHSAQKFLISNGSGCPLPDTPPKIILFQKSLNFMTPISGMTACIHHVHQSSFRRLNLKTASCRTSFPSTAALNPSMSAIFIS